MFENNPEGAAAEADPKRVLVVEDQPDKLEFMQRGLMEASYRVEGCTSAEHGLSSAMAWAPDLALIDSALPGIGGRELCRRLKSDPGSCRTLVVIVSGKGRRRDIARMLSAGADDYLLEPITAEGLIARVESVLRRGPLRESPLARRVAVEDLVIDPDQRKVHVGDESNRLTNTELRLLHLLASHPGRVFPREQLIARVIRQKGAVVDRNIDVHIGAIRRKMGPYRDWIQTVRGIGYCFREKAQKETPSVIAS